MEETRYIKPNKTEITYQNTVDIEVDRVFYHYR